MSSMAFKEAAGAWEALAEYADEPVEQMSTAERREQLERIETLQGTPSQDTIDGDPRSAPQRNHDALKAGYEIWRSYRLLHLVQHVGERLL